MTTRTTDRRSIPNADGTSLDSARARYAALISEQAELPALIDQAKRASNAEAWMAAQVRSDDIGADLVEAEMALRILEAEEAWQAAEAAIPAEEQAAAAVAEQRRSCEALVKAAPSRAPLSEMARHSVLVTDARTQVGAAETTWRAAQDDVCRWLVTAERAEARAIELGADPDQVQADRSGVRAVPRPLTVNINLTRSDLGSLANELDDRSLMLPAGTVPPRWIAHRLGPNAWEEPRPAWGPTAQDLERSRRHAEDLAAREAEVDYRTSLRRGIGMRAGLRSGEAAERLIKLSTTGGSVPPAA